MTPPTTTQVAIGQRDAAAAILAVIQPLVDNHAVAPLTEPMVDLYRQQCSDQLKVILDVNARLLTLRASDPDAHKAEFERLFIQSSTLQSQLHGIKNTFPPAVPTGSGSVPSAPPPRSDVRLPRLDIAPFNGDLMQWISFRDIFTTIIHNNASYSGTQKLAHLKTLVQGEPARLINSIILSDANYDIAWDLLQKRYQNDREFLFAIIRRFHAIPSLSSPSGADIRNLADTTRECLRSLDIISITRDKGLDAFVLFHLFTKMDQSSREQWEQSLKTTSIPKLDDLLEFLEQRARSAAAGEPPKKPSHSSQRSNQGNRTLANVSTQYNTNCKVCKGNHPIYRCPTFNGEQTSSRTETIKKLNLCFNCLQSGHSISKCPSTSRCRQCNGKHHSLIHKDKNEHRNAPSNNASSSTKNTEGQNHPCSSNSNNTTPNPPQGSSSQATPRHEYGNHAHDNDVSTSMLATALIQVTDGFGQPQICRAFLDSGATSSFMTQACQQRLRLKTSRTDTQVLGLTSASVGNAKGSTALQFASLHNSNYKYAVTALILPKITGDLPIYSVDPDQWTHLNGIRLADPNFHAPKPIDILLGSDIFWHLLSDGKRIGPKDAPLALNSKLGWLVAGPTSSASGQKVHANVGTATSTTLPCTTTSNEDCNPSTSSYYSSMTSESQCTNCSVDSTLRRFWELESISPERFLSQEERDCEQHFISNYTRLKDGRFQVRLPLKSPPTALGDSKTMAIRRLKQLEKRLMSHPEYQNEYLQFMKEYEDLGHMSLVEDQESEDHPTSYIPHHFVLKESSTTTKFRVVFDASAKSSSGMSLNDIMMVGPVIQDNLVDIVMRFRINPIAYTADIAKMYRQIRLPKEDAELQRILWRKSPDQPIQIYRLDTVAYGTASAPYLATRVLHQLAQQEASDLPIAAAVLQNDLYVDDLMSGSRTVEEAKEAAKQVIQMTARGGMSIRKWSSNSKELMASLPEDLRASSLAMQIPAESNSEQPIADVKECFMFDDNSVKCLGILWDTNQDCFLFKVNLPHDEEIVYTKRQVLSEIARLFDPLGWLAPVIISAKIFMQSMWKLELSWDEPLPQSIQEIWIEFKCNLKELVYLRIPRCVIPYNYLRLELAGFCDASERAYAAVVYLCVYHDHHTPIISLIASKTRVAPAKTVSLPKLELCGAHLLSKQLAHLQRSLKLPIESTSAWSDSTVTLAWIRTCPSKLKVYVANRVSEIISKVPVDRWHHIPGNDNPADCASRGITVRSLIDHHLWWNGPSLLLNPSNKRVQYTSNPTSDMDEQLIAKESKSLVVAMPTITSSSIILGLINSKSNFSSLINVVGWIQRFIHICRHQTPRYRGHLRVIELRSSLSLIIKAVQQQEFPKELQALQKNEQVDPKSKISSLSPILDENGLLRVGGRLRNASISYDQKHPLLLPRHSKLTEMLIMSKHRELLHAGPQLLLAVLQRQFWIVRGRDAVRFQLRKCITCHRHRATTLSQVMADLPPSRVTPNPPFHSCGVDYAGPFNLKPDSVRSKTTYKAYICLFVCFTTRAIHIEIASSLSTSAFLAALKRFVSRRNCPAEIFSDCGTNFVGAARELKEFQSFIRSDAFNNKLSDSMSSRGIQWNFNPPSAPHFGGLWEAGVKSVKFHLHRVLGAARLTYEEMSTLMCQIEACLNSRPLTPLTTNPDDLAALTPGHFLTGSPLTAVPEPDLTTLKTGRLDRWQLLQQMKQHFWIRWSNEFLSRLQQRPKWLKQRSVPQVGDLVTIKDEHLPPQQWRLGRIETLHPGADGLPRVADLKTSDGIIRRPIVKLSLLPIDNSSFNHSDIV